MISAFDPWYLERCVFMISVDSLSREIVNRSIKGCNDNVFLSKMVKSD